MRRSRACCWRRPCMTPPADRSPACTRQTSPSSSMARRMDFVQRAARRLVDYLRPRDRIVVLPFARTLGSVTGPTDDRHTVGDAIGAITGGGGTAIYDAVRDAAARLAGV